MQAARHGTARGRNCLSYRTSYPALSAIFRQRQVFRHSIVSFSIHGNLCHTPCPQIAISWDLPAPKNIRFVRAERSRRQPVLGSKICFLFCYREVWSRRHRSGVMFYEAVTVPLFSDFCRKYDSKRLESSVWLVLSPAESISAVLGGTEKYEKGSDGFIPSAERRNHSLFGAIVLERTGGHHQFRRNHLLRLLLSG